MSQQLIEGIFCISAPYNAGQFDIILGLSNQGPVERGSLGQSSKTRATDPLMRILFSRCQGPCLGILRNVVTVAPLFNLSSADAELRFVIF